MNITRSSTLEIIPCPSCGKNLCNEDNIIELCSEPFAGIVVSCLTKSCGTEVSLNLEVRIQGYHE